MAHANAASSNDKDNQPFLISYFVLHVCHTVSHHQTNLKWSKTTQVNTKCSFLMKVFNRGEKKQLWWSPER